MLSIIVPMLCSKCSKERKKCKKKRMYNYVDKEGRRSNYAGRYVTKAAICLNYTNQIPLCRVWSEVCNSEDAGYIWREQVDIPTSLMSCKDVPLVVFMFPKAES